jgi:hypothetical protein
MSYFNDFGGGGGDGGILGLEQYFLWMGGGGERDIWCPETNFAEQRGSCLKPIKLGRMGSLYVYVSDLLELSEILNMSAFMHLFYKESTTVYGNSRTETSAFAFPFVASVIITN